MLLVPTLSLVGAAGYGPWAAVTEGQRALAKAAARAWGSRAVTVNCVAVPGPLLMAPTTTVSSTEVSSTTGEGAPTDPAARSRGPTGPDNPLPPSVNPTCGPRSPPWCTASSLPPGERSQARPSPWTAACGWHREATAGDRGGEPSRGRSTGTSSLSPVVERGSAGPSAWGVRGRGRWWWWRGPGTTPRRPRSCFVRARRAGVIRPHRRRGGGRRRVGGAGGRRHLRRARRCGPQRHQPPLERGRRHRRTSTTRPGTTTWRCRSEAPTLCAVRAAPSGATQGGFVLMTSPAAMEGSVALPAYAAVKGAVRGLAKSLAVEWGPLGVGVVCLSPLAHTPALERAYVENPDLEDGWLVSSRWAGWVIPTPTSPPSWCSR